MSKIVTAEEILREAGYEDLRKQITYNDHVIGKLVWGEEEIISTEENANIVIEGLPPRRVTKALLDYVRRNFDVHCMNKLAEALDSDPTNRQNRQAGELLGKAIRKLTSAVTNKEDQPKEQENSSEESSKREILETLVRKTSGSTALLRSYVANRAGNRWKTLSDNLRVEESTRDCFLQNCIGLTNDAIACVLNHWAGGNTEQKATWSVLLTAMKESDMRGEADNLEKKLLEGR